MCKFGRSGGFEGIILDEKCDLNHIKVWHAISKVSYLYIVWIRCCCAAELKLGKQIPSHDHTTPD